MLSDGQTIRLQTLPCHFDRSEAEWRNLPALRCMAVMPFPPSCLPVVSGIGLTNVTCRRTPSPLRGPLPLKGDASTAFRMTGPAGRLRSASRLTFSMSDCLSLSHVISTVTKRSGEISLFYGTGCIGVGDFSTQSFNRVYILLTPYRHAAPLEMTAAADRSPVIWISENCTE